MLPMTPFGKILIGGILFVIVLAIGGWVYIAFYAEHEPTRPATHTGSGETYGVAGTTTTKHIEIVAENLSIPWDIAFLPDDTMLVTERSGRVIHIGTNTTIPIEDVEHVGEGGLLGIALHPDFASNRFVYLYHTVQNGGELTNRVVRYRYEDGTLSSAQNIITDLPGAPYHDGGRIAFGPQRHLWVTVGDATDADEAQNAENHNGTILRLNEDGSFPDDNPYPKGVYSYGHRNPQGLAWDDRGRLWSTEHGRSGVRSGMDELNLIETGGNYGWPEIEGDETRENMIAPKAHSGSDVTWAPASATWWDGSIFFGGLRGEALCEAVIEGDDIVEIRTHVSGQFGRIRTVKQGPDGYFYITTSNRDGRGDSVSTDDRIIKVDPHIFR